MGDPRRARRVLDLGTIDRVVYANYESLIALAAAAGAYRAHPADDRHPDRAAAREHGAARQAGRDDRTTSPEGGSCSGWRSAAARTTTRRRRRRLPRAAGALSTASSRSSSGTGAASGRGPARAVPPVLIGGGSDAALRRAARYADGWTMGGGGPGAFAEAIAQVERGVARGGARGRPRTSALCYFALGDGAEQVARSALGDYYGFLGEYAERVIAGAATDETAIRELRRRVRARPGSTRSSASRPRRIPGRSTCSRAPSLPSRLRRRAQVNPRPCRSRCPRGACAPPPRPRARAAR